MLKHNRNILTLCIQKTKVYMDRLDNYLDQWRSHVLAEMGSGVAKCRPLWDVLQGVRFLLCSHFLGNLVRFTLKLNIKTAYQHHFRQVQFFTILPYFLSEWVLVFHTFMRTSHDSKYSNGPYFIIGL